MRFSKVLLVRVSLWRRSIHLKRVGEDFGVSWRWSGGAGEHLDKFDIIHEMKHFGA